MPSTPLPVSEAPQPTERESILGLLRQSWRRMESSGIAGLVRIASGVAPRNTNPASESPFAYVVPPDPAIALIAATIIEAIGAGSMSRPEFAQALDACLHGQNGYVEAYNSCTAKGTKIGRVDADALRSAYALFEVSRAEVDGEPMAVIDGTLAQFVADANEGDEGPYRALTRGDLADMARAWCPGASKRWQDGFADALRAAAPRFETVEQLGLDELRIRNGVFDRKSLTVRPYTPHDHFIAKFAGIEFPTDEDGHVLDMPEPVIRLPDGNSWRFSSWLSEIMPDDDGKAALLDATTCLLMPQLDVQRAFVLFGMGRNGKGTWVQLVQTMVGPDASELVAHLAIEDFADEKKIPHIQGRLMNLSDESNPKGFLGDTAKIKAVATHDIVGGRPPYGQWREWRPVLGLLFCLNAPINSAEHSDALYERFVFVNFPEAFFRRENPAIKNDYMRRREVASYAAYLALVRRPRFYDASVFAGNPYVQAANAEHRSEADPTVRAWRAISDDLEGVDAIPCQMFYQLMRQWKKRYEPNGRVPGYTSREFRSSLRAAAEADGWELVPDQLATCKWLGCEAAWKLVKGYADRVEGYTTSYRPTELACWGSRPPARTRTWLVKRQVWERYQESGDTPF